RLFEFAGVAPLPGITELCFTADRQRYGPGDYKIWNTTKVTASSVGRGWRVPARLIPADVMAAINDLADQLGYVQVTGTWGVGSPPADLRVALDPHYPVPAGTGTTLPKPDAAAAVTAAALAGRVQAGLLRLGEEFTRSWHACSAESVLLFATALDPGATAWWRLDLGTGTVTADTGDRPVDTDWSVTGSAGAWQRVLNDELNLSVAFRGGELRYADKGDHGAGSAGANIRVAMIAELLGIISWRAAD
ncbi:MAG: hypothetical protein ACRDN0_36860, partial [Trebonia sp.]